VIGLTAVILLIVGAMAMSSQVVRVNSSVNRARDDARYAAESGIAYTTWMIIASRQSAPANRSIGEPPAGDQHPDVARWLADGSDRRLDTADDITWRYRIRDTAGGLAIADLSDVQRLRLALLPDNAADGEDSAEIEHLVDSLADYIDGDDLRRLHGMERDEYSDADSGTALPRNARPITRQELYWLPVFPTLLARLGQSTETLGETDILRPAAPAGQRLTGQLSLLSTPGAVLRATSNFTADEWTRIDAAVAAWRSDQVSLRQSLGDLYPRVSQQFSIGESGVYTIDVTGEVRARFRRRAAVTLDLRTVRTSAQSSYLIYWESNVE